jgi:hypothetical protein
LDVGLLSLLESAEHKIAMADIGNAGQVGVLFAQNPLEWLQRFVIIAFLH